MSDPVELRNYLNRRLPEAIDFLREMVEINSFTENPAGVDRLADLTASKFAELGFQAKRAAAANPAFGSHLVLRRPGKTERNLAMIAHLDTVFPPEEERRNGFGWLMTGDRIYGPGTCDIKGGTAMMWLVLSALRDFGQDAFESMGWTLLWNAAEEQFSPDFLEVCRANFDRHTRAALVFEAEGREAGIPRLVVARKGRATWRATVAGRGAHAGNVDGRGANAVVQLGRLIGSIDAMANPLDDLTVNVATVQGGTVLNRVPHQAAAEGEFRTFSSEVYDRTKADLLALNGPGTVQSSADGFTCQVTVEILTESHPWPRNPATDRLYAIWEEVALSLGRPIGWQARGGLSDGNQIWDLVPTLDGLGPWGDNAHCSERSLDGSKLPEFVEVATFSAKAELNTLAILKLAEEGS